MKKINQYKLLAGICVLSLFTACDFEELNTNPFEMTDEMGIRDGVAVGGAVMAMQRAVITVGTQADDTEAINQYQVAYNLSADSWSGFFGQNNNWYSGSNNTTYYLQDNWVAATYTNSYTTLLSSWKKIKQESEKNETPEIFALAQILKISAWHKTLESFGPIPYTHAGGLVAAYDKFDSVGIMDSFFPEASFFTEMELFDRHCSKLKRTDKQVDMVSICTPNYLHDAHIRYGLRLGSDVICEKPLVLNPWNIDALAEVEKETGHKVNNILQLRLHESIKALKKRIDEGPKDKVYDVDLTYITSRGNWYYTSWKGDIRKSGGVATNIGVHFYDMLTWIFGPVKENIVHVKSHDRVAGFLGLEKARVRYFLSINGDNLPENAVQGEKRTYRSIQIEGEEFEFSQGFTELHTESYRHILSGEGFGLDEVRNCINIVHTIRNAEPIGLKGDYHPLAKFPLVKHPFGWDR